MPLTVLALLTPAAAGAQQRGKPYVDPKLRMLMRQEYRDAIPSARADLREATAAPLAGVVALDYARGAGSPRVAALVELHDPSGADELRAHGAEVGTMIRDREGTYIATVRIPVEALPALAGSDRIVAMEAAPTLHAQNDSGVASIRADQVRSREGGTWTGYAGQGVIVGVYDTGLDFRHDDFLDANGKTRVLALWDQTSPGTPPAGFTYGNLCTQASIQAAIDTPGTGCTERDYDGHGTHVTGTAAGDGSAVGTGGTAYQYAGVAPAADLLIVKGGDGNFTFDNIADGITWMRRTAQSLGKRIAINLSLGGIGGPADGTSLVERRLDAEVDSGAIIVASAGNSGSNGNTTPPLEPVLIHAGKSMVTGESAEVQFEVPAYIATPGRCNDYVVIDLYYSDQDEYDITLVRPDGTFATAAKGTQTVQDSTGGEIFIDNGQDGPMPADGDIDAHIEANDCTAEQNAPAPGLWTLRLQARSIASGRPWHLWMWASNLNGGYAFGRSGFDNRFVVGTPGTAKNVITVGAYVTKLSWLAATGSTVSFVQKEELGDLARFSSGGPSRDGRLKPEITAPGLGVMSALSRDALATDKLKAPDGVHWVISGTSMAAPHVTGAVALFLQKSPELTAAQIKALLASTGRQDAFTLRRYDPAGSPADWWGYGKLDVKAGIDRLGGDVQTVATLGLAPRADTLPTNATLQLKATPRNYLGTPIPGVAVTFSSSAPAVASVDANGTVKALAPGNAFIVATGAGLRDSAAIVVVPPAKLAVTGTSLASSKAVLSAKGTRIPLLSLQLAADGYEDIRVRSLAFDISGDDPAARVVAVHDVDGNAQADAGDPVAGSAQAKLTAGTPARVTIDLADVTAPRNGTTSLILAIESSGQVPNATAFSATYVPEAARTIGVRSQAVDQIDATAAVASAAVHTTVLKPGEVFALSENPVLSDHVVFNFSKRPRTAGIYSLTGRRIIDLTTKISSEGRVDWDLRNEDGGRIAAGVYLVVFDVDGQLVRRKLIIAPGAAPAAPPPGLNDERGG
ncbi:MAG: S8 family serine peptidase, partial [Gemmatimonadetes bacterium]|nr:S8 family serine peptidase [Gemmatimonadota bacterium]